MNQFIILFLLVSCVTLSIYSFPSSLDPNIKFYDPKLKSFIDESSFLKRLELYVLVFFGEEHDHSYGHWMENYVLNKMIDIVKNDSSPLALGLEMFERDTQPWLTFYLNGDVTEKSFLASSRPWPNYETDYKPMIESMKKAGYPVLAANVPRRYAHHVVIEKENILFQMPDDELSWMAKEIIAPLKGIYWDKFYDLFKDQMPLDKIILYFRSQCLKDDTMARSVVEWWNTTKEVGTQKKRLLFCSGDFHVENFAGLYEKVATQIPNAPRLLLTAHPYDPKEPFPDLKQFEGVADVVIFLPKNPPTISNQSSIHNANNN